MMLYKARILKKNSGFSGELMRGRVIEYQLDGYATDGKAVHALNQKIKEYNEKHHLAIPPVSIHNYFVTYETAEPEEEIDVSPSQQGVTSSSKSAKTAEAAPLPDIPPAPEPKAEPKPTKPKRKPFTPYGLNGYLVDKQGNVRLMLDRKANAQTIVLTPEMFSSLAEMVKKTQEQQNAN